MNKKIIISIFLLCSLNVYFSQGCSDAGFCTIESFRPHSDSISSTQNYIKIGASVGSADNDVSIFGTAIEYGRSISDKFGFDVRLTALSQSGNNISNFNLADVYINSNYKVNDNFSATLGVKLPLNSADDDENNLPLPMDYQSSLGTVDLILGLGYKIKKLQLVAALQQPLTQNKNKFINSTYDVNSPLRGIQSTNDFERAGDVLLRISYPFEITQKLSITPSLLNIYHLAEDKFTDIDNVQKSIKGSDGITVNGNLYIDYKLSSASSLQLNIGAPFAIRDARPDGLTRSFVANLEYRFNF